MMKILFYIFSIIIYSPGSYFESSKISMEEPQSFTLKCADQQGFVVANKSDLVFGINGPVKESVCIRD